MSGVSSGTPSHERSEGALASLETGVSLTPLGTSARLSPGTPEARMISITARLTHR